MNIFFVHKSPKIAAQQLCDKHVVKMVLETAQMLCAVSWRYDVPAPYKLAHKNHPMTRWCGDTYINWGWALLHGLALAEEYTRRYNKAHKSDPILQWAMKSGGRPQGGKFTTPPLCMPDEYKTDDFVQAYRNYYIGDKSRFAKWKLGNVPSWFKEE